MNDWKDEYDARADDNDVTMMSVPLGCSLAASSNQNASFCTELVSCPLIGWSVISEPRSSLLHKMVAD